MDKNQVTCNACRRELPTTAFYVSGGRMKRPCKECTKARSKATYHRLKAEDPEGLAATMARRNRRVNLRTLYGITVEQYEAMRTAQDGRCAICGIEPDYNLAVDHCHDTGAVRALLCIPCNVGIGNLGDDPERVRKAAEYLEAHRGA